MIVANRVRRILRRSEDEQPSRMPVPATTLEEKQDLLAHHVRLVAREISYGLFVSGPGGLGKSRTIQQTLTAEGISPVLINSHMNMKVDPNRWTVSRLE